MKKCKECGKLFPLSKMKSRCPMLCSNCHFKRAREQVESLAKKIRSLFNAGRFNAVHIYLTWTDFVEDYDE